MSYIGMMGECNFGYAAFYSKGDKKEHQFSAAYSPMAQKDCLNFSYINRASQRLQLFCELKGKMDGMSSEFLSGFRMRFMEGTITGYMNSNWVAWATYAKNLEGGAMRLEFNS